MGENWQCPDVQSWRATQTKLLNHWWNSTEGSEYTNTSYCGFAMSLVWRDFFFPTLTWKTFNAGACQTNGDYIHCTVLTSLSSNWNHICRNIHSLTGPRMWAVSQTRILLSLTCNLAASSQDHRMELSGSHCSFSEPKTQQEITNIGSTRCRTWPDQPVNINAPPPIPVLFC